MARRDYYCNVESRMGFLKVEQRKMYLEICKEFRYSWFNFFITCSPLHLSVSLFEKQKYICNCQIGLSMILNKTAIMVLEDAFGSCVFQVTVVKLKF